MSASSKNRLSILKTPIAVLGAGSWGTALALLLAHNGNPVRLWDHTDAWVAQMRKLRENTVYLPGYKLPENIELFTNLTACVDEVNDILVVVPSHAFAEVLQQLHSIVDHPIRLVWGTKGLDPQTRRLLHHVAGEIFSKNTPIAALSGPSFAKEVAARLPTAVSLASNSPAFSQDLIARFSNPHFRVYENPDLIGVELCGVVKNVLAIAVGMADGQGFGANTRAALITRGLAELQRLCLAVGGKKETVTSLAGVGDLVLTCTDDQSRNRRFGLLLGQGVNIDQARKKIGQVVEGWHNAEQVFKLSKELKVDMPITTEVYQILHHGHSVTDAVTALMQRELTQES